MRIEHLHVYGFGQMRDESWRFRDGLNIVFGHNEAGKSTLLAFIRGILFGFESRRHPEHRYEPVDGGPFGGMLTVVDEQGQTYRIERVYRKKIAGDVTVYLPDGGQAGEAYLEQLVNRMDEKVFKNVFAFGLSDLQRLKTLNDAEVNRFIYTAGTGDGHAIMQVQKVLSEKSAELYRPNSRRPLINTQLRHIRETRQQVTHFKRENAQYDAFLSRLRQLEEEMTKAEQQRDELRRLMVWQEKLLTHFDDYEQYVSIADRLTMLPAIESFPEDGIQRLSELEQIVRERRALLTELQTKYDELHDQLTAIHVAEDVLMQKFQIERLHNTLESYRENVKRVDYCTLMIQQEKNRLSERLASLGAGWTEESIQRFDGSYVVKEAVRRFAEQLKASHQALSLAEQEYRAMKERYDELERKIAQWQMEEPERPVMGNGKVKPFEQLQAEQDALDELARIDQRLGLLTTQVNAIRERLSDLDAGVMNTASKTPKDDWLKWGTGIAAVIVPLLLWFFQQPLAAATTFGLLTIMTYQLFIGQKKRVAQTQHTVARMTEKKTTLEQQLRQHEDERNRLKEDYDTIMRTYQWTGDDVLARKHQLEQERKQLIAWNQWDTQRKQLQLELEDLAVRLAQKEKRWKEAQSIDDEMRNAWRAWLSAQQFPGRSDDVSPETVLDMMRIVDEAKTILEQITRHETEQEMYAAAIEDFVDTYVEVVRSVDAKLPEDDLQTGVIQLVGMLERAEKEAAKRGALSIRLEELADDIRNQTNRLDFQQKAIEELFASGGATDGEMFRRRGQAYDERRRLLERQQELSHLFRRLAETAPFLSDRAHSEPDARMQRLLQEWSLTSRHECEDRIKQLQEQLDQLHQRIKTLHDEQVAIKVQLKRLADGEKYAQSRYRLQQLLTDLEQSAHKWAIIELANHFVTTAIREYEQTKQPRLLQRASHFFSMMTGGRYRRVFAPIHQETVEVEREDGRRLAPSFLSRGTVEQLYLAIRLALIEEYSHQALLPVVFDDILVNFDEERTLATIRTLEELANERQILFFTCHSYVVDLFRQERVPHHFVTLAHGAHVS